MLSKKIFSWMHKVALFAIIFASLAPSISHALAAQQGVNTFAQEICKPNGEIFTIQVITSKGQAFSVELNAEEESSSPASVVHHLNHCPFCANPNTGNAIEAPHAPIIALLEIQTQQFADAIQAALPHFSVLPPPAQAPPSFN